jgi:hypothetical protein
MDSDGRRDNSFLRQYTPGLRGCTANEYSQAGRRRPMKNGGGGLAVQVNGYHRRPSTARSIFARR